MRPIVRSSSLSRIRWALKNIQERNSSTFYSKSRRVLIGVNQNQALVNTRTHDSTLYTRLSTLRGLSAEAVEAADPAARLIVSDMKRTGPLVEYERRINDGELMTGDICQVLKGYGTWIGANKDHWSKRNEIGRRRPNHRPTGRWFCSMILHIALEKSEGSRRPNHRPTGRWSCSTVLHLALEIGTSLRRSNHRPTGRWFWPMNLHIVLEKDETLEETKPSTNRSMV